MLYTHKQKGFKHHVHPTLQRRMRMFLLIGTIALATVLYDMQSGQITWPLALGSIFFGGIIGFYTSRIFNLTWSHDGKRVVGQIDRTGWYVLGAYIAFEIARAVFFEKVVHTGSETTAITFAFVSSALLSRVFGLRGRILTILKEEKVL